MARTSLKSLKIGRVIVAADIGLEEDKFCHKLPSGQQGSCGWIDKDDQRI